MGVWKLLKNTDEALAAISREALVRAMVGAPAKSRKEAALHDWVDTIPIVGDIPSFLRILQAKGNRLNQSIDAMVGAIPIVGDVADFLLTADTNIQQFEDGSIREMGPVESFLTFTWVSRGARRYIGGEAIPSIWHD